MPREPCVYILASRPHGAIYTDVTSDLTRRVWQHKLVWMEPCETMDQAIAREKQIKCWSKTRQRVLIDQFNPEWRDLYGDLA